MHFLASSGARRRVQCCAGGFAMMLAVVVHVLSPSGAAARDGAAAVALSAGSPIAAGFGHTCAVTAAGGAKCWGWNGGHGQIGDGTSTTRLVPVDVKHLTRGVAAIAADEDHTCAVTAAGGAKCWGSKGIARSATERRRTAAARSTWSGSPAASPPSQGVLRTPAP